MANISFSLDRLGQNYQPGDVINLEARIQVDSECECRSIYAKIKGYAHVQWSDRSQSTGLKIFSSDETFLQNYQTLAGNRSGIALSFIMNDTI